MTDAVWPSHDDVTKHSRVWNGCICLLSFKPLSFNKANFQLLKMNIYKSMVSRLIFSDRPKINNLWSAIILFNSQLSSVDTSIQTGQQMAYTYREEPWILSRSWDFFITQCFVNPIYPAISSKIPMEMAKIGPVCILKLKMVDNVQNNDYSCSYKPMHKIFRLNL
jgi:hypothetical protein